jgi:hypothetical protein
MIKKPRHPSALINLRAPQQQERLILGFGVLDLVSGDQGAD